MESQSASDYKRKNIPGFFFLTFLFSWLVWGSMILFEPADHLMLPLLFLGAFGPTFAAIFFMHRYGNSTEKRDFWRSVGSFTRINWKWYLFIFLFFPAILFIGYPVYSWLGGSIPSVETFIGGVEAPADFLILLGIMILGGPLAEELGWRGYALDPMQQKWGALKASLVLGVIWIAWHLPLFFIEGTSQHAKGFGIAFWSWSLQLLFLSVIFTWVYNHTNKSILGAILLHLMANMAYPTNLEPVGEVVFTIVRTGIALAIIIPWVREISAQKRLQKNIAAGIKQPEISLPGSV